MISWTDLLKGGINGFFSVVVSLSWWLKHTDDNLEALFEFETVLEDVMWVQDQMILSLQTCKRKHQGSEKSEKPAKRFVSYSPLLKLLIFSDLGPG